MISHCRMLTIICPQNPSKAAIFESLFSAENHLPVQEFFPSGLLGPPVLKLCWHTTSGSSHQDQPVTPAWLAISSCLPKDLVHLVISSLHKAQIILYIGFMATDTGCSVHHVPDSSYTAAGKTRPAHLASDNCPSRETGCCSPDQMLSGQIYQILRKMAKTSKNCS